MQNFIIRITQENFKCLNNELFSCFILPENITEQFATEFAQRAHKMQKLVLVEGTKAVDLYAKYGADGLILDTSKEEKPEKIVKALQKKVPHAVLGVVCRNRRHEAMLVSECEPDFVIFKVWQDGLEKSKELLSWYAEFFLIQCAAQIEDKADYADLAADLVILNDVKVNGK